jgi:hypothetical protein
MSKENIVVTAGYDKSPFVLDVVHRLSIDGVKINSVIVIKTLNVKRISKVLRTQGFGALFNAFVKSKGQSNITNKISTGEKPH